MYSLPIPLQHQQQQRPLDPSNISSIVVTIVRLDQALMKIMYKT